jgi:hypothetical protein
MPNPLACAPNSHRFYPRWRSGNADAGRLSREIGQCDAHPHAGEAFGGGETDPARGAGDDGDVAGAECGVG